MAMMWRWCALALMLAAAWGAAGAHASTVHIAVNDTGATINPDCGRNGMQPCAHICAGMRSLLAAVKDEKAPVIATLDVQPGVYVERCEERDFVLPADVAFLSIECLGAAGSCEARNGPVGERMLSVRAPREEARVVVRGIAFKSQGSAPCLKVTAEEALIDACLFDSCADSTNSGQGGVEPGAGALLTASVATVRGSAFKACQSGDDGGGVLVRLRDRRVDLFSSVEISNNSFTGCAAADGGGVAVSGTSAHVHMAVAGTEFERCTAGGSGGALSFDVRADDSAGPSSLDVELEGVEARGCSAALRGGAIALWDGAPSLAPSPVTNATAAATAGFTTASASVRAVRFANCSASNGDGASGRGGALYVSLENSDVELREMEVAACTADGSGAFEVSSEDVAVSAATVSGCSARLSAVAFAVYGGDDGRAVLESTRVQGCAPTDPQSAGANDVCGATVQGGSLSVVDSVFEELPTPMTYVQLRGVFTARDSAWRRSERVGAPYSGLYADALAAMWTDLEFTGNVGATGTAFNLMVVADSELARVNVTGNAAHVKNSATAILGGSQKQWDVARENVEFLLTDCVFADNVAYEISALSVLDHSLHLEGCSFLNNRVLHSQDVPKELQLLAAVDVGYGDLHVNASTFEGNNGTALHHGPRYETDGLPAKFGSVQYSVFTRNGGDVAGGAISSLYNLAIDHCEFHENRGHGAALYFSVPDRHRGVDDSRFLHNSAAGLTLQPPYGGVFAGVGALTVRGSMFHGSEAEEGGVLWADPAGHWAEKKIEFTDCTFELNSAERAGVLSVDAKAVLLLTKSLLRKNEGSPSVLFLGASASASVDACTFRDNNGTARAEQAVQCVNGTSPTDGSQLQVSASTFYDSPVNSSCHGNLYSECEAPPYDACNATVAQPCSACASSVCGVDTGASSCSCLEPQPNEDCLRVRDSYTHGDVDVLTIVLVVLAGLVLMAVGGAIFGYIVYSQKKKAQERPYEVLT